MDSNRPPSPNSNIEGYNVSDGPSNMLDSEETEDAKDKESSSSNVNEMSNELDDFRQQWQREIEVSPFKERRQDHSSDRSENASNETNEVSQNIEDQARSLFLRGVQAEKARLLESAISYYRKAVQLVPDIEFRIAEFLNDNTNSNSLSDNDSDASSDKENMPYDDFEPMCNLVERFQKVNLNMPNMGTCQPNVEQKMTHISVLPPEILIYILKWVVSTDLDLLSLEQVSKVSRGFYLCARDSEIWRLACQRIWDSNLGLLNKYGSWRNMFLQRPHVFYNGTYISKTTYIRYGEPSFQDSNYRPCYLVSYFRYMRFFPDGLVLMYTTPDDPYQCLFKLRYRKPKCQSIQSGLYKIVGNTIIAVLRKPKGETHAPINYYKHRRQRQVNLPDPCDETYHVELELRNVKNRINCQLIWKCYSIHMVYRNGDETVSDFDLTAANFPPFWFSRVKSYTAESDSPLK